MADESTTTTLTETIRTEVIGAAVLGYMSKPGVSDFVTVADITGMPTLKHVFPIIDNITALAIAEATDYTTNSAVDSSGSASATVSEHAVKSTITDLTIGATQEDFVGTTSGPVMTAAAARAATIGTMFARALIKRRDQDLTALFGSFNSSTGTNTGALTSTLLTAAVALLDENDIPEDRRVAVLHPTQFKALVPVFDEASTFGAAGAQIINRGVAAMLYGAEIFRTTSVGTATVSSSTVYAGCIMHPDAIGLVNKGQLPTVEVERDASARMVEVVGSGVWGEAEYRGGATTSGRGGAGIYFYSNTTNQ